MYYFLVTALYTSSFGEDFNLVHNSVIILANFQSRTIANVMYESSAGLFSTTNPKPRENHPSACLLRQIQ